MALPGQVAGVYKHGIELFDVSSGSHYQAEDILEIVPYKPGTAYFRASFKFDNSHICDISGIAEADGDQLIYHGPNDYGGAPCTLFIHRGRDGIRISEGENGACRNRTCGARGTYGIHDGDGKPDFKFAARRPIRYLPRLLASREYAEAVKGYEKQGK